MKKLLWSVCVVLLLAYTLILNGCATGVVVRSSAWGGAEGTTKSGFTVWFPCRPMGGVQLMAGNVPGKDAYGNAAAGSVVVESLPNVGISIRGSAFFWPAESKLHPALDFRRMLEHVTVNNQLVTRSPTTTADMLSSFAKTKAHIDPHSTNTIALVMQKGDYVDVGSNWSCAIGRGSEMRFADNWVAFLGEEYRKGGFRVSDDRIVFANLTEKRSDSTIYQYRDGQWQRVQ